MRALLQALAPPEHAPALYPEHLFETLKQVGFSGWPDSEKRAVMDFLGALQQILPGQKRLRWIEAEATLAP